MISYPEEDAEIKDVNGEEKVLKRVRDQDKDDGEMPPSKRMRP